MSCSAVDYNLTAPTSGDFAGFVFYQRPTTSGSFNISGANKFLLRGRLVPAQLHNEHLGSNTATISSPFTALIGNSFNLSGSGTWSMTYDPARMTVPVPAKLHTGNSTVGLVN